MISFEITAKASKDPTQRKQEVDGRSRELGLTPSLLEQYLQSVILCKTIEEAKHDETFGVFLCQKIPNQIMIRCELDR
jgi:hypothetical protein